MLKEDYILRNIYFPTINMSHYGKIKLKYVKQNSKFVFLEVIGRGFLCCVTALMLICWVYRLHNFKIVNWDQNNVG